MAQTKSKSPVQFDPEEGNDENIDIPVTLDGIDLSGLSVPQHNACDILAQTSVAQLRRFNLAMELPCCDKVNTQIVLAFTPFCAGKGVDLSSEGITAFKLAHGLPGNPTVDKPTSALLIRALLSPPEFPPTARPINSAGMELIKSFEKYWKPLDDGTDRVTAYLDAVHVPTIGWGHTDAVKMGDIATREQSEAYLKQDTSDATAAVAALVKVPLNDNQFSALSSFVFNVGGDAFKNSTMLKLLNKKDFKGASKQFLKWNHAGGHTLPGLTRRRKEEQKLFLAPIH